jgi:hypothetical protein
MLVKQRHLSKIVGCRCGLRRRIVGALARRLAARNRRLNAVGGRVGRGRPSLFGTNIVRRQHAGLPCTLPALLVRLGIGTREVAGSSATNHRNLVNDVS